MSDYMSADSLKNNLTNPGRVYLWDVIVPVPIGGGDSVIYSVRARTTQIPGRSNDRIEIPYKQTAGIVVAGKLKYDQTWTCSFMEGEDRKVFDAVRGWQQYIVDDTTGIGVGDQLYKTDVYLTNTTVANETWSKIKIKGAWISNVGAVSLSQTENGIITYDVTFTFDSWTPVSA